jgi:hypothetical protein
VNDDTGSLFSLGGSDYKNEAVQKNGQGHRPSLAAGVAQALD